MFDVSLRADESGVPVPLAGRAILFAGADGLLKVRRADGSVVDHRGPAGPAGRAVVAWKRGTTNASATPAQCLGPVVLDAYSAGGAVLFDVRGEETNGILASSLVMAVRVNGAVVTTATVALGTTAQTARGWRCSGRISFDAGSIYVSQFSEVAGLAPVSSLGKVAIAGSSYSVDVVYSLAAAVLGVSAAHNVATMNSDYLGALS